MSNEMSLLSASIVVSSFLAAATAQSVVQQCLSEQVRNNLNSSVQSHKNATAEMTTIAAFESICRHYGQYMNCFQARLNSSELPADRFLDLIFSQSDMQSAYRGLCTLDLENLRPNIRCLLSTPEVRHCYSNFNQGINKVVSLQKKKQLPTTTVQQYACNVSVTRYLCETDVYAFCDSKIGQIMQDFYFAGIPESCRKLAGVKSRYVNISNDVNVPVSSETRVMVTLSTLGFFCSVIFRIGLILEDL